MCIRSVDRDSSMGGDLSESGRSGVAVPTQLPSGALLFGGHFQEDFVQHSAARQQRLPAAHRPQLAVRSGQFPAAAPVQNGRRTGGRNAHATASAPIEPISSSRSVAPQFHSQFVRYFSLLVEYLVVET